MKGEASLPQLQKEGEAALSTGGKKKEPNPGIRGGKGS